MNRDKPRQEFPARDAHEALLVLKEVVDDAAKATHAAELESFSLAIRQVENHGVRRTLQNIAERYSLRTSMPYCRRCAKNWR
jgi:hypothetical protein